MFTTNSKGEVFLDIEEERTHRKFSLTGSIRNGKLRKLDESLWLLGNTSIGYNKDADYQACLAIILVMLVRNP